MAGWLSKDWTSKLDTIKSQVRWIFWKTILVEFLTDTSCYAPRGGEVDFYISILDFEEEKIFLILVLKTFCGGDKF